MRVGPHPKSINDRMHAKWKVDSLFINHIIVIRTKMKNRTEKTEKERNNRNSSSN